MQARSCRSAAVARLRCSTLFVVLAALLLAPLAAGQGERRLPALLRLVPPAAGLMSFVQHSRLTTMCNPVLQRAWCASCATPGRAGTR